MKKAQVLLALAVLIVCTACSEVVAAPVPTPTLVPILTPVGTPDLKWSAVCAELEENLDVCLLAPDKPDKIEATLLTGPIVVAKLIFVGENLSFHTLEVEVGRDEVGYEAFVIDAERDLSDFDRVFIYTKIGDREWGFGYPVAYCRPQNP